MLSLVESVEMTETTVAANTTTAASETGTTTTAALPLETAATVEMTDEMTAGDNKIGEITLKASTQIQQLIPASKTD